MTALAPEEVKTSTVKQPIIWFNVVVLSIIHLMGVYGLYVCFRADLRTFMFAVLYTYFTGFGVTGGAHRLWTHRSYKANVPLRIILILGYCGAGMNTMFDWVRDHRVHHKFSETDADPHNSNRGLFFSHVGWLMMKKHPEVLRRGKDVDMSDVTNDPVVQFQQKYFKWLQLLLCYGLPISIPCYFWGETLWNSFFVCIFRWVMSLNIVWSVNSFAHTFGYRPYNRNISPAENIGVSVLALGEGWHNYHHAFPWDYKTAEFGIYKVNITTMFIDFFAAIGWAYDLKQPSKKLIESVVKSSGDGSHPGSHVKEIPEEEDLKYRVTEKMKGN